MMEGGLAFLTQRGHKTLVVAAAVKVTFFCNNFK